MKRCFECGHTNDDERLFCTACGSALDTKLKLIMDIKEHKEVKVFDDDDDDEEEDDEELEALSGRDTSKPLSAYLPLLIGALVVGAIAAYFLLA